MTTHYELQREVFTLARQLGLHAHACGMRTSQRGFPDLVIIGRGGVLWRELKIPPDQLTSKQRALGYTLAASGQNWWIWRPEDLASGRVRREMEAIR